MKSLTSSECEFLLHTLLPALYLHWVTHPYSLLGRILGVYRVQTRSQRTHFMLLPNAFCELYAVPRNPSSAAASASASASACHALVQRSGALRLCKKFDLKGSTHDRSVFVCECMCECVLYLTLM
jgi:hypothetical protein